MHNWNSQTVLEHCAFDKTSMSKHLPLGHFMKAGQDCSRAAFVKLQAFFPLERPTRWPNSERDSSNTSQIHSKLPKCFARHSVKSCECAHIFAPKHSNTWSIIRCSTVFLLAPVSIATHPFSWDAALCTWFARFVSFAHSLTTSSRVRYSTKKWSSAQKHLHNYMVWLLWLQTSKQTIYKRFIRFCLHLHVYIPVHVQYGYG